MSARLWAPPEDAPVIDREEKEKGDLRFRFGGAAEAGIEHEGFLCQPGRAQDLGLVGNLAGAGINARSRNLGDVFSPCQESPTPLLNIGPFTSFPGQERQAAFRPTATRSPLSGTAGSETIPTSTSS